MALKQSRTTVSSDSKSVRFSSNTITPPVRGAEAALILESLRTGKGITNPVYEALIEEIIESHRLKAAKSNVKNKKSLR
jgi:hypothetical protein